MTPKLRLLPEPATPKRSQWAREAQRRFILARNAFGMTQEAAADYLGRGAKRRTISRWESGEREVPGWALVALEALVAMRDERSEAA